MISCGGSDDDVMVSTMDYLLRLEIMESYSPLQMEPLGITEFLVQQTISMESPTETVHS